MQCNTNAIQYETDQYYFLALYIYFNDVVYITQWTKKSFIAMSVVMTQ